MKHIKFILLLLPFAVNGQQFSEADEHQETESNFVITVETDAVFAIKLSYDSLGGYYFLPDDLLNGKYNYVFGWFKFENKQNVINFYWDSWMIDGRYNLRFTPKQMVLYTSHENPNPDYIYWSANITEEQFQALKKIPKFKYKWLSDKKKEKNLRYKNFERLLRQINQQMGNLKFTIPSRKEFDSVKPIPLLRKNTHLSN